LDGRPIACLRISYADVRARHRGLSHHDIAALKTAARGRATIVVPRLAEDRARVLQSQLESAGILARHDVTERNGEPGLSLLAARGVQPRSMGRDVSEAPELFLAAAAAGAAAAEQV
jgi:hypothetical protein